MLTGDRCFSGCYSCVGQFDWQIVAIFGYQILHLITVILFRLVSIVDNHREKLAENELSQQIKFDV